MSAKIDERVVEMRFDNKQFEQETKRTMSTLSKLKEALKIPGAEKALVGVDKAARNIHLEGIAEGVKLLSDRFSTMGIVSMQVIENITNALTNKLARAVNFVSDAIVSGGIRRAMNIENAHFQLQALLKDEIKVQAVMDNAMESVDGTAYAYDEAAKAASMFAASGLEAGEEMLQALKGITGVAAMTNSDFESMSMIFTSVAGQGRLMGDQLLQLSSRGLNAASTIADYFREVQGQAGMTEGAVREMVSKGQISFKDFANAMSWAFGDSAKRANETFTGAMSNMKSALARIGAEFVSPLVEQNGEMVNLFNALRIKINDVKKALAFDVQASAISGLTKKTQLLVQTVADMTKEGSIGFDQITSSILGASKSEEELTEINEKLSKTFEAVKENGFASSDMLIDIRRNGIDVFDALDKYINGVTKGTIRATGELKKSVRELTNGTEVSKDSIYEFASQGKISFDIFNNAIVNYSGLVEKNSKLTSDALNVMFSTVKEAGSVSGEMLKDFQKNGIAATSALVKYINGVNDGTVRASYATKKAIEEMTGGIKISGKEIQEFADKGVINFDMFKSAMENSFGDSKALTKQVTDFILDHLKSLVEYINNLDMTKPMELFYYGVEIVKNGLKGLGSVIRPVTKAASQVFSGFSIDDMIKISARLEELTAKLQLNESKSENLRKAFKGVFDIIKALIDIVKKFVKALNPSFEPVDQLGEGLFGLAGNLGECLSKFAEWISTSETVNKGIEKTAEFVGFAAEQFKNFGRWVKSGFDELRKSPVTKQVMESFGKGLETVAKAGKDFIKAFGEGLAEIPKFISEIFGGDSTSGVDGMAEGLQGVQDVANGLDFEKPISTFERLKDAVSKLGETLMGNKGINVFVTNVNEFFDKMVDAFQAETLEAKIDAVTSALDKFIDWIQRNMKPLFGDVTAGGVIAAGSGIGMIYSIMKMAKSFESVANKIKAIPDMLGPIKSTLTAYQKDLKADQLLKIAKAIGILGITLTIMSFADFDQMMNAAVAMAGVAAVVLWASSKFIAALNQADEIPDVLNQLAIGMKSALKNFGRAIVIKSVSSAVKDLGKTLVMLVGSIAAIFYMNKTDPNSLWQAVRIVSIIGSVLFGIMMGLIFIDQILPKGGFANWLSMAGTILSLGITLSLIVSALNKLYKMKMPSDWQTKTDIFILMIGGLAGLIFVIGAVSQNTKDALMSAGSLLAVGGMLYLVVMSINNLFKMSIPTDYAGRLTMLVGVVGALVLLMAVMSGSAKSGQGAIKAGGTMLGVAAVLVAVTWSLGELAKIPGNKLARAVFALDGVILALAVVFAHMDNIGGEKDTGKSVLYMAGVIAAVAVSLGVLSMIPLPLLAKSVAALGTILLALALDFAAIGQIKTDKAVTSILAMIAVLAGITASLIFLSEQPWEGLLAGAASVSLVLLAFAGAFRIIGQTVLDYKTDTLFMFLSMVAILASITGALVILAGQPWDGLLAAGASLSMVLLAFAAAFKIMGETVVEYDLQTFALMASLVAAIWLIVEPIAILSEQPWDGLLASATSLSMVLLAISASALIISKIKINSIQGALKALGFLDAFIVNVGLVLAAAAGIKWVVAQAGGDLDELLKTGTGTLALIANGIGAFVGGILAGIGGGIMLALGEVGKGLSDFMNNAKDFFSKAGSINESATKGVKNLAEAVLIITAADVMEGLFAFVTGGTSMQRFGQELEVIGPSIKKFADDTAGIDADSVEGAARAIEILGSASKSLTKHGGVLQAFTGETISLATFAEELEKFGEKIVPFAEQVKGIDAASVQGAADAGEILAEMAKTLPKADGFAQLLFGETKSLSEFGAELALFGPGLVTFAALCGDITPDQVEGAAASATILSEMAQNMPDTNSLWEKWFGGGTQSITSFSSELNTFGGNMNEFAAKVKDFDGTKIDEVTKSFKALVELANFIQEDETDSMYLTTFASNLSFVATDAVEAFCKAFEDSDQNAKDAVKGLVEAANTAVTEVAAGLKVSSALLGWVMAEAVANGIGEKESLVTKKINELAVGMLVTLETSAVSSLFDKITQSGLNGIVTAIRTKQVTISSSVRTLGNVMVTTYNTSLPVSKFISITQNAFQGIITGINAKRGPSITITQALAAEIIKTLQTNLPALTFNMIGLAIMTALTNGIESGKEGLKTCVETVGSDLISNLSTSLPNVSFVNIGVSIMNAVVAGINSQTSQVQTAVQNVVNNAGNTLADPSVQQQAQQVGQNIATGVGKGISSTKSKNQVKESTKKTIKLVPKTAKAEMLIHSPSRVMIPIGEYISFGLAEGIVNASGSVVTATERLSEEVVNSASSLSEYVKKVRDIVSDEDFDINPVITPVIDSSQFDREISNLNQKFADMGDLKLKFQDAIKTPTVEAKAISGNLATIKMNKEMEDASMKKTVGSLADYFAKKNEQAPITMQNEFNINGENSEEIAYEVSRILQQQVERKERQWA